MLASIRFGKYSAALVLVALTLAVGPRPTIAKSPFPASDCKIIARTFDEVWKRYHQSVLLSPAFWASMVLFLSPDKKNLTCNGDKDIEVATKYDAMAFKMVTKELLSVGIDLKKAGVFTVAPPRERAAGPDLLNQKPASPLPDPDAPVLFTMNECKVVTGRITQVLKVYEKTTPLSAAFRDSLISFVSPDRKTMTCDGAREIVVEKVEDAAAFLTIRRELLDAKISLQDRGVRTVLTENSVFTQTQCNSIYNVSSGIIGAIGIDATSTAFRQSLVSFFGPQNKCDGPRKIAAPTAGDVAAFNQIRETLLAGSNPISLYDYGVRAVAPASR